MTTMKFYQQVLIQTYEAGLHFVDGEFVGVLAPGRHRLFGILRKQQVDVVSRRDPWLRHDKLDVIARSGKLGDQAVVIDLTEHERAIVMIDGRFDRILKPGLYVYWNGQRKVEIERYDARDVRLQRNHLSRIAREPLVRAALDVCEVQRFHRGVLFYDGKYVETLEPGVYAFWRETVDARVVEIDLREQTLDVAGQEIMTADKVTLRLNLVATYRVVDPLKAAAATIDVAQALYRETQLAARAVIGARELDVFLAEKENVADEIAAITRRRAETLGLELITVGVRDVILPGEMKDLLNKVTQAKKAAEANLIFRREETAAMRSQANTARLLAENPTLMRLRELEVLEKIAAEGKLNVVVGERGLADRIVNLL
ncbi:slipin family protein [Blastopirellula sp. JC732]|uniref:Slipin family protein n=1 Tax=Blastopirellula sediminis TaxID=2894196 RepID=A0A9X1MNH3_9BACT|nr:slipin family protein [Blastopirellula sediminis]MCC9607227.1 slipin family protein [Blastopirellula sediminis]MCC9629480.1 slipin family protein [Blastopirellula sediminis]